MDFGVTCPLKCPSPVGTVYFSHWLRAQPGRRDGDPLDWYRDRNPVGNWVMPTVTERVVGSPRGAGS